jgi:sugar phosphate isomerase/epimerase
MAELEFKKYDLAIHEGGKHLRPSQVAADVSHAAARLRHGLGLVPGAFSVAIEAPKEEDYLRQFQAVCRLARICSVPLLTLSAAPADTPLEDEVQRLTRLVRLADADGLLVTVATLSGTLTQTPDKAVQLCEQVPGLGLTLDPSHYIQAGLSDRIIDPVFPHVLHTHLRDTGKGANQFQVRVGQGAVEYGRIVSQLARHRYDRLLTVDIRDIPDSPFAMEPEVRKLKYLLESLI